MPDATRAASATERAGWRNWFLHLPVVYRIALALFSLGLLVEVTPWQEVYWGVGDHEVYAGSPGSLLMFGGILVALAAGVRSTIRSQRPGVDDAGPPAQ